MATGTFVLDWHNRAHPTSRLEHPNLIAIPGISAMRAAQLPDRSRRLHPRHTRWDRTPESLWIRLKEEQDDFDFGKTCRACRSAVRICSRFDGGTGGSRR